MLSISLIEPATAAGLFPIALLLSSAFCDIASVVTRRSQFQEAAYRIQVLSAVACVVMIASGLLSRPLEWSAREMTVGVVRHLPSWTTNLAVCAGLAYWRVRQRNFFSGRGQLAFALVSLAGVVAISATGYLGAHLAQ